MKSRTLLVPAVLSAMLTAGIGCESDNDKNVNRDRVHRRDRLDDRLDRPRVEDDLSRDSDLRNIPRNAVRVDSARGSTEMEYEPRRSGTIYVYDVDADKVVYSGRLREGDRFLLDADDNIATVNGKKMLDTDLKSRHVFRLYFDDRRD